MKAKKSKEPVITVQDISDAIERSRLRTGGNMLFRPQVSYSFVELDYKLVRKAFDDIVRKISLAEAGVDEFTAAEKMLFILFREHAKIS